MGSKPAALMIGMIVVGASVGIGIGYAVFHDHDSDRQYWYYIDYGTKVDGSHKNRWLSGEGSNAMEGLKDALKKANLQSIFRDRDSNDDWIIEINGVANNITKKQSWGVWVWLLNKYDCSFVSEDFPYWIMSSGLNDTIGNTFYIGFTNYELDPDTYAISYSMKPNNSTRGWGTTGPFAPSL